MNNIRYKYKIDGTFETIQIKCSKTIESFVTIISPTQLLSASAPDIQAISPAQLATLLGSIPLPMLSSLSVDQVKNLYGMLTPDQIKAIPSQLIDVIKAKIASATTPTTTPPTTTSPTTPEPTTGSATTGSATTATLSNLPICQSFYLCSDCYNKNSEANNNCPNMCKKCSFNT
jgi:hypothetical protein